MRNTSKHRTPPQLNQAKPSYGGQDPLPTLTVRPRETLGPLPAMTRPTCLVATGEVVMLNAGLTVWPAGINTLAGIDTPARLLVESDTVKPPGPAGPVR